MFASRMVLRKPVWFLVRALVILAMIFSVLPVAPVLAQASAPTIVSPEVGEGGVVTFRYYAPDATKVQLYIEAGRNDLGAMCYGPAGWPMYDMTKDTEGVWSYTLTLEPNLYNYHFTVTGADGEPVNVFDPNNPTWDPAGINSQAWVPGEAVAWVGPQDVPHGKLKVITYHSAATGTDRPLAIYTPPDYGKNSRTYPTLYLSHGAGGNHIDWTTQGAANNIIDNLIAQKKIRPMVVVMTNFYGLPDGADAYRLDLINSVIPAVEARYKVNRNPDQRAFGGLSMGAMYASNILMKSPGAFGFYGIWSGSIFSPDDPGFNNPLVYDRRGIFISIGARDFLYDMSMAGMAALDAHDVSYQSLITPGDCHTWYFWRESLYDFLTTMAFKVN